MCVKASGYTRRLRIARVALCIDGDTPGASVPSCELYVCSLQGRSSAKAHRVGCGNVVEETSWYRKSTRATQDESTHSPGKICNFLCGVYSFSVL